MFFPDYGLVSYTFAGEERWRTPLGPFNNVYGMGSSPILAGDSDQVQLGIDPCQHPALLADLATAVPGEIAQ